MVVAALAVILVLLLANAGSCSRSGGMGAAAAPGAAAPDVAASGVAAEASAGYKEQVQVQTQTQTTTQTTVQSQDPAQGQDQTQPAMLQATAAAADVSGDVAMSLVYDVSGSMADSSAIPDVTKLESAQQQSRDFVSSVANQAAGGTSNVRIGIVEFDTDADVMCGLTSDSGAVLQGIESLTTKGLTNMYAGLELGIGQLRGDGGQKVIVLLSDGYNNEGHSNSEVLDLAKQAAGEGIVIHTVGFGPASSLDESLLEDIASTTGGVYSHEDASSISASTVGLYGSMMNAKLGATSQVLLSETGSVAQGQTVEVGTFDVAQGGTLQALLYSPANTVALQLLDPNGDPVGNGYPGAVVDDSSVPASIQVDNAQQGTWKMTAYGRQASPAGDPFYAAAALSGGAMANGDAGAATTVTSTSETTTTETATFTATATATETEMAAIADAAPAAAPAMPPATGTVAASSPANNAEALLFLLIAVVIACLGGVYAFSRRNGDDGRE